MAGKEKTSPRRGCLREEEGEMEVPDCRGEVVKLMAPN
jgi:hypothetical protein